MSHIQYDKIGKISTTNPIWREKLSISLKFELLAHGNSYVDAQIAVFGEQLGNRSIENETIWIQYGRWHAFVDGTWRRLPRKSSPVSTQFQP